MRLGTAPQFPILALALTRKKRWHDNRVRVYESTEIMNADRLHSIELLFVRSLSGEACDPELRLLGVSYCPHSCPHFMQNLNPGAQLVKESDDLASNVLASCLFVIHNASACGQDDVTELTRRQQLHDPFLEITELDIVAGRDDTSLVETSVELDDNLAAAVIVDFFELADVAWNNSVSSIS